MDTALKITVTEAANSTSIFALNNIATGYMGSLTKDIINHVVTKYGWITVDDIKQRKFLQELLETSQSINVLFNIINDGVRYASEANTPFLLSQVLQMDYHSVSSYGIYTDACND